MRLAYTASVVAALICAVPGVAVAADPVIGAAGDIACSSSSSNYNAGNGTADKCRAKYTSDLLVNAGLAAVLPLGDTQYESASLSGLNNSYAKSWGRVKSITRPAPGNHEYKTANAAGYFDYFNGVGQATGPAGDRSKGYYSFDVGTWHLIALNSTDHCTIIPCGAGSAQETWLKADLAANSSKYCTMAFWHDPRFNSGHDGNADEMAPMFQALYNADADVVLGGHAHDYERFAPQNPSGQLDNARGIRQFVVGTGGAFWTSVGTPKPNSQVRQNTTYGVLKMTLHPTGYDWQFAPEAGKTFTDSGTGTCHGGTAPPADTTKPSIPGNLRATAGTGQVALTWNASTDNVGVTGYRVFRGTLQVATLGATTSWTDTGLAPGPYSYTVRAVDAAGNLSDPSTAATTTVADTTKPAPPGGLGATASGSQVSLSWLAATDDVGVTGYRVFRGTQQIGTPGAGATSYTDTGLSPGPYSYTVRAVDAAGNLSDPSNTATATIADTEKPSKPGTLTATGSPGQVALTWGASTDNVGVTAYGVYRGPTQVATLGPTATSWTDTGLAPGDYSYTVRSVDAANNFSDYSNAASATVPDVQKPSIPGNLRATPGAAQVTLDWDASHDDVGVTGYEVLRGGSHLTTVSGTTTSYTNTGLAAGPYSFTVRALDAAGHQSDESNTASAIVPDTTKPGAPTVTATLNGTSTVDLSWTGSSDDVGVTDYDVYRNGGLLGSVGTNTTYSDTSLAPGTYDYTVYARDAAGNVSLVSNTATATVLDVEKPTAPPNLEAKAQGSFQVDLKWDAATDNVGVTHHEIYRDGLLIDTIGTARTYSDHVLVPTSYTYEVRALDAAGNRSDASNSAHVTLLAPDDEPPTAPQNLDASAASQSQVDLTWDESQDNVLVTGYRVYRDDALLETIGPLTSYSDTSVTPGDHSYFVIAFDATGNDSDPSNTAQVTVSDTEKPTAPSALTATANGSIQADLSWTASSDNVAVTKYRVIRDDEVIAEIDPATSWSDTVIPGTYTYQLRALDAAGNVSDPSNTATVTVYPPDVENPTPPQELTATAGAGKVDLGWQAASDNRGVTGYEIYRDDALIDTVDAVTSYTDHNLAPAVEYRYVLRALDGAGNKSDPSNEARATVPDTQKPGPPTNLVAAATASQVDLTWNAAHDDVAVTGYNIYRDGQLTGTVGAVTTYSDTSVAAPGYDYEVRAFDAAGHLSDPSNKATATVPDGQKPGAPGTLSAAAAGPSQVNLSWGAAADNIGVTGYRVYRDTQQIASPGNVTSWSDTGVAGSTTYAYEVRAVDAAGNLSDPTNSASVTTPAASATFTFPADADAKVQASTPTTNYATTNLRADGGGNPVVESFLRFTVSGVPTGSVRSAKLRVRAYTNTVDGPAVYATNPAWTETAINWNNRPPRTSPATDDKGNIPSNTWVEYDVTPFVTGNGAVSFDLATTSSDGVDIYSREAATLRPELVVTTGAPDTQKPFAPTGLSATAASPTQVNLSWNATSDNVGVTGYQIVRNGNPLTTIGALTAYSDTTAAANTPYTYQVRALDAAGNISDPSNTAPVTTPAAATVLTIPAEADARVQASAPTTNYGTSYLRVDGATDPAVESYLRFTVTGAPAGSVLSAKLRVYAYSGTADGPAVYTAGNSWTETAINWNTRPARTSPATDDKGAIATNTWVEYDVTPFVTGNGTYSFNLATTSTDGADIYNREAATLRPELVVTKG